MDLSHDSSTILGQLRKGQAESNMRLDALRVELQRLNVHLEQLAAAVATRPDESTRPGSAQLYLSQVVSTLRPKALAMWAQVQSLPRDLRTKKLPQRLPAEPPRNGQADPALDPPLPPSR